ncbi:MAG: hypothetical protein Q3980_16810, partial [Turicibacter sp.]|nr:hypothetical protein [Turicibacter sp.]
NPLLQQTDLSNKKRKKLAQCHLDKEILSFKKPFLNHYRFENGFFSIYLSRSYSFRHDEKADPIICFKKASSHSFN